MEQEVSKESSLMEFVCFISKTYQPQIVVSREIGSIHPRRYQGASTCRLIGAAHFTIAIHVVGV
jgi:hypothetical protein